MILVLKLTLVPVIIVLVTLAARRWGSAIGGVITALPVVAGPVLFFYAIEQGNPFASRAAHSTLLAVIAVQAFCVTYARCCIRMNWKACLALGWGAFVAVTFALYYVRIDSTLALIVVFVSSGIALWLVPRLPPEQKGAKPPAWDLPLRMVSAVTLALTLTALAGWMGPRLSGLFTPFPVATAILASFSQVQRGPNAVVGFFRGLLPGLNSFAVFCYVLSRTLAASMNLAASILLALGIQLTVQALILWWVNKNRVRVLSDQHH